MVATLTFDLENNSSNANSSDDCSCQVSL